jgi:hypothetical protein
VHFATQRGFFKALFASFEGRGGNREVWVGMSLEGYFFFIIQNLPIWGTQKLYWMGVWRVYINFSNLINVVIIFLNS